MRARPARGVPRVARWRRGAGRGCADRIYSRARRARSRGSQTARRSALGEPPTVHRRPAAAAPCSRRFRTRSCSASASFTRTPRGRASGTASPRARPLAAPGVVASGSGAAARGPLRTGQVLHASARPACSRPQEERRARRRSARSDASHGLPGGPRRSVRRRAGPTCCRPRGAPIRGRARSYGRQRPSAGAFAEPWEMTRAYIGRERSSAKLEWLRAPPCSRRPPGRAPSTSAASRGGRCCTSWTACASTRPSSGQGTTPISASWTSTRWSPSGSWAGPRRCSTAVMAWRAPCTCRPACRGTTTGGISGRCVSIRPSPATPGRTPLGWGRRRLRSSGPSRGGTRFQPRARSVPGTAPGPPCRAPTSGSSGSPALRIDRR